MKITVFWYVKPSSLVDAYEFSEKLDASTFRIIYFSTPNAGTTESIGKLVTVYQCIWFHITEYSNLYLKARRMRIIDISEIRF
jgi:hypothetical protein